MFQERFKGASRNFQECLKKVSRVFQDGFKGVSRKIEGYFEEDFSGYLKEGQREFQGIFRRFKDFSSSFNVVSRVFQKT